MADSAHSQDLDPLDLLAEEFLDAYRRGERPSPAEYARRHPDLADRVLGLFPVLIDLEEAGSEDGPRRRRDVPGRIGEFTILRTIGAGGMGVVYEAVQESLGRHVALKVLPAGGELALERFRREARTAALLHHTNIVPVFAIGEAEGVHYYAMQYIRGKSLHALLADARMRRGTLRLPLVDPTSVADPTPADTGGQAGRLAPPGGAASAETLTASGSSHHRDSARIAAEAAEALAFAHAHGVLHRDIKPSNILIDERGDPWLTDFGLAKREDSPDLTATGDLVGTLRYLAPERLRNHCDVRSDVYALGATLYEMLTLRPAYEAADRLDLVARIGRGEMLRPRRIDPRIPANLETIVLKAMAHDPSTRYASASDLAEDLRRFLSGRPIRARRAGPIELAMCWGRRNPAVASLLASVGLLLLAMAAGSALFGLAMGRARDRALASESKAVEAREALVGQLARSRRDNARAERLSRRIGQRFETLEAVRQAADLGLRSREPAAFFDDLRTQAIAALALPDLRRVAPLPGACLPRGTDRIDASMRHVACCETDGQIALRGMETGEVVVRLGGFRGKQVPKLSRDGRIVATNGASGELRVWEIRDGRGEVLWEERSGVHAHDVRPDGREAAAILADGSIIVRALDGVAPPRTLDSRGPAWDLAYSPEGRSLAVVRNGAVGILDVATGRTLATLKQPGGIDSVAWHPDGRRLAVACDTTRVLVWDATTARILHTIPARIGGFHITFSPDGHLLAGVGWDGVARFFDPFGEQRMASPAEWKSQISLDGRMAVGAGASGPAIAEVATCANYRALEPPKSERLGVVAIHPGGRLAAGSTRSATVLWDLATGRIAASLPTPSDYLTFTRSGDLLLDGREGLIRWPIRESAGSRMTVGPPARLDGPNPTGSASVTATADGRLVAVVRASGPVVLDAVGSIEPHWLAPREDVRRVALSPDGRWVAVASWDAGGGVSVYETSSGRPVHHTPGDGSGLAEFSPDGRWLAVSCNGQAARLLEAGTWRHGPTLDSGVIAFARDADQIAVAAPGAVRLLKPETGRELARIESPGAEEIGSMALSADGSRLILASPSMGTVHFWDLRSVRRGLTELDLDWADPPFAERGDEAPLSLELVAGLLPDAAGVSTLLPRACHVALGLGLQGPGLYRARARHRERRGDERGALADLDAAAIFRPGDPTIHENLGRILLETRRDYVSAEAAFGIAAKLAPDRLTAHAGRGECLLGLGRWAEAADEFTAILARRPWDARAHSGRGRALRRLGRLHEAVSEFSAAIEAAPSDLIPRVWRGACYEALNEVDRASEDRALGVDRLAPEEANNTAWLLVTGPRAGHEPELALPLATRGVVGDPRFAAYRNTLGFVLLRLGRCHEALVEFEASLRSGDPRQQAFDRYPRAVCLRRLGRPAAGWAEFLRAICAHLRHLEALAPRERAELDGILRESLTDLLRMCRNHLQVAPGCFAKKLSQNRSCMPVWV